LIEGIRVYQAKKNLDERGYFAELFRDDWRDFLGSDHIVQLNTALTFPGIIRAWHRHKRGQNDYFVCLSGAIKVCAYDERDGSGTKDELVEIVLNGKEKLEIARITGECWHGYKSIGPEPALIAYGTTQLYDYKSPDEERRSWNDPKILPKSINGNRNDPRVGVPYDWNFPPHK
jgi:dTDP-4-dehydrorhamnose 3,5-epimerase